jgi:hypothetical protein
MIDKVTLSNFRRFMQSGIPLREFGPQGAFDSKPRARDDEPDDKPARERRDYIDAMDELAGKISPEAFDTICDAIRGKWAKDRKARDGDPASQFKDPMDREMHQTAQDSKLLAFDATYPGAANIKRGASYSPVASYSGDRTGSSKAERELSDMIPGFGDIKVR